ncbi:MAG: DUF134 domain-containing protein [Ruminococcus sp.]
MPRPCKRRRICEMPKHCSFAPVGESGKDRPIIRLAVDEYEAIRLIDLEDLNQEECAGRMGVARTTVQAIYNSARRKLAQCLVEGKELRVDGGDYILCEGNLTGCHCRRCHAGRKNKNSLGGGSSESSGNL